MGSHLPVVTNRSVNTHAVDERRHAPRFPTARLVRVAHDGCTTFARCRDISDTGVKLNLLEPIEPGEHVEVAFSSRVRLRGRVIWVEGPECGVAFDREIDSVALLNNTALEARAEFDGARDRAGRDQPRGAATGSRFQPGLNVVMILESGREERAMLNWTTDQAAGLLRHSEEVENQGVIIEG